MRVSPVIAVALLVSGCGGGDGSATEATTPAGLAAAVYAHLDPVPSRGSGGANPDEKWISVSTEVATGAGTVPLDVLVFAGEQDAEDPCADTGEWILSCESETAADGSTTFTIASTEDLTGGRSEEGMFVFVGNVRDGETVLVIESLESRGPSYVDLSGLPIDRSVLEEIATDPRVGSRTTAATNDAGEDLPGFAS